MTGPGPTGALPLRGVRLLADDLTGALDAAAEFAGLVGPVQAFWSGRAPGVLPVNTALDTGTRELGADAARAAVVGCRDVLRGAEVAFKKMDSLLRGQSLAELAACFAGGWDRCVLAPAFPYQGRITRAGRQYARVGEAGWRQAGPDLVAALRAWGVRAQHGRVGAPLSPGITVFDAEADADLDAVVATGRLGGPVLWSGTAGLARALAQGHPAEASAALPGPVLGLFGSDQEATAAQLAACHLHRAHVRDAGAASMATVARVMERTGAALVSLDLPAGLRRDDAAARIGQVLHAVSRRLPVPGTLLVAGGETLRGLCIEWGATSLEVRGRIAPGLPRSILRGGAWDGVTVVSKSGAFGHAGLLLDLLRTATHS